MNNPNEQDMTIQPTPAQILEKVIISGDLEKLSSKEKLNFYSSTCQSLGLNPLTRPFEYIRLNNKLTLYARKDATEQLRAIHDVSVYKLEREVIEGVYVVTAYVRMASGREDSSLGAVSIEGRKGDDRANAMMKAETKAKRRATLSICGLGFLDETEIETIPNAVPEMPEIPESTDNQKLQEQLAILMESPCFNDEQRDKYKAFIDADPDITELQQKLQSVQRYIRAAAKEQSFDDLVAAEETKKRGRPRKAE